MKKEIFKELPLADLKERLEGEKEQLSKLKITHAVSPIDNPKKIKTHKLTIARILTELRSRELAEQKA